VTFSPASLFLASANTERPNLGFINYNFGEDSKIAFRMRNIFQTWRQVHFRAFSPNTWTRCKGDRSMFGRLILKKTIHIHLNITTVPPPQLGHFGQNGQQGSEKSHITGRHPKHQPCPSPPPKSFCRAGFRSGGPVRFRYSDRLRFGNIALTV
jgi:hypothetical protein